MYCKTPVEKAPAKDAQKTSDSTCYKIRYLSYLEWLIAYRYIRSKRREASISIIACFSFVGILVGVASLVVVMSVMNGFRDDLFSKVIGLNGHIEIHGLESVINDYPDGVKRLSSIDGVDSVVPYVIGHALVSGNGESTGAIIKGIKETDLQKFSMLSTNIIHGTLDGFDHGKGLVIGEGVARSLGISVGDSLTLINSKGRVTPFGIAPQIKSYVTSAIFSVGMPYYDDALVFMPLAESQEYFKINDVAVTAIDLYLSDPNRLTGIHDQIHKKIEMPVTVLDWREVNTTLFSALELERRVMFVILSLIILVASLNVISGLTMLVKDKAGNIAIMRTMGASRGFIMRVFFIVGMSIGVSGTLFGLIAGLILCWRIDLVQSVLVLFTGTGGLTAETGLLSHFSAIVEIWDLVFITSLSVALSFLATAYPAWKAACVDPIEALRYE